jgi:hypothetical protein
MKIANWPDTLKYAAICNFHFSILNFQFFGFLPFVSSLSNLSQKFLVIEQPHRKVHFPA